MRGAGSVLFTALLLVPALVHGQQQAAPEDAAQQQAVPQDAAQQQTAAHQSIAPPAGTAEAAAAEAVAPPGQDVGVGAGAAAASGQAADATEGGQSDDGDGWGEDDAWGGNDNAGFAPVASAPPATTTPVSVADGSALSLSGFLRSREALWVERFDDNPLAQARQSADFEGRYKTRWGSAELRLLGQIHLEYDLSYLNQRDSYDDATLDAYEWQIIGGESFAALSLGPVELTLGRQVVTWGQGEMLSPLDVVNPRDMREPGLAELDDIRMAILASRLGVFFGAHRLEMMVVHESFFGLQAAPLSDFSPLRAQLLSDPAAAPAFAGRELVLEHVPGRFDLDATQYLGRWSYVGEGIDVALYVANVLDRQGVAALPSPADFAQDPIKLRLYHPRYTMVGHAGALPVGDVVLRWELGSDFERPLMVADLAAPALEIGMLRRTQLNWMAGVTYAGISDGNLGLEYAQAWVIDAPASDRPGPTLLAPVEQPAFALRYSHNFLRETLQLVFAATAFGIEDYRGLFARAEVIYALQDALKLGLGYATFQPHGDGFGPLSGFDTHDRVFTTLRWDFALH